MKNSILKLTVVRILLPKPHMLLFSFIININYPVGEERVNIHHQTSGFGKSFAELNTTCEAESVQPPFSGGLRQVVSSRERNKFVILRYGYIYSIA